MFAILTKRIHGSTSILAIFSKFLSDVDKDSKTASMKPYRLNQKYIKESSDEI